MAYGVLVGLFLRTVEFDGMRFVLWQALHEPKKLQRIFGGLLYRNGAFGRVKQLNAGIKNYIVGP